MDDERIRQLTEEVVGQLRKPEGADGGRVAQLEARVAALEAALARGGVVAPPASPAVAASRRPLVAIAQGSHPSLQILQVETDCTDRCILEPDKPCTQSQACKTFGH